MREIILFTEEESARIVCNAIAETLELSHRTRIVASQGKSELESTIVRKIGHWRAAEPPRFIVMRDNDGSNCKMLKTKLFGRVPEPAQTRVKIRIVMQELESWYLGDLDAVVRAGLLSQREAKALSGKTRFRDPDRINNAKQEFIKAVRRGGQIEMAERIGPHLDIERNRSKSFTHFVDALRWAAV